jgi:3-keto-5-aminohexanoate cleavage enzyme
MATTTMITVAPAGAAVADLVRAAKACGEIGASVVLVPAPDPGLLGEAVAALREQTELVVRADGGLRGLDAVPDAAGCPLDDEQLAVELHTAMRDRAIVPAYEVTGPDQATVLCRLLDRHGLPYGGRVHCELVLSGPEPVPALAAVLPALPPGATFSATGRGTAALPAMLAALAAGGHLRVGLADTPDYAPGEPARDNAQLVARAAGLARIAQRPPAPVAEARELLGVRP